MYLFVSHCLYYPAIIMKELIDLLDGLLRLVLLLSC